MVFFSIILPMKTAQISDPKSLQKELTELRCQNSYLKEQVAWFQRQIFGSKSERIVADLDIQQLLLEGFEGPEVPAQPAVDIIPAHERRKPNRNGQDKIKIPDDLPVETIFLDIPEEQKICQETGKPLIKIGEDVSHKLAHKPGSFYIKEIIRPKYAYPQQEDKGILTADLPESILSKCLADNSLLAEILVRKFADHLPLYRLSEIFLRDGIGMSRKLLSQWVVRCGIALTPLYNEMLKQLLESGNIFVDESPVNVLEAGQVRKGYMWVVVGGNASNPPHRIYGFSNRCYENIFKILAGYRGVLHSDKYGAYEALAQLERITWCPCWAHIRRKFFEAEAGDPIFRKWVLRKIRYLFMLEQVAWSRSPEERLKIRQEKEALIIDEIIKKVHEKTDGLILPKSKFSQALGYFRGLIPYIKNYTQHAFARLDNNVAERAVRPLAIGRKNWLFFGSDEGGQSAAIILSLVQTCRGLGINPREYLEDIFGRLMSHNSQKLQELMPDQWLRARQQAVKPAA